jgi:hypothetical protein
MPRFVVLVHDWPRPHWDFLAEAEAGGTLRAWRLLAEPTAGADVPAEPNADHRPMYLDYEGPVSGDRGTVARWDAGTCDWRADEADHIALDLHGAKIAGRAELRRTNGAWVFHLEL